MLDRRRSLTAAAFGALLLTSPVTPLGAQATNTVGPPVLENFQLPGQRTTPPAPEPQPATPPAAQTTTPPPATETPRPEPRATTPEPRRETPRPAPRTTTTEPPAPASTPAPQAEAPVAEAPVPELLPPAQPAPPPAQTPAPAAEAPAPGPNLTWLYFAGPAALGLLAFLLLSRRRRRAHEVEEELDYVEPSPEPEAEAPAVEPTPEPEPVAPAPIAAGPRPWLELDLTPERTVATDTEAVVHYELILRNTGGAPARNIRIDTKLFNASEEAEMNAFFAGPIHDESGSPHIVIEPGSGLYLVGQVALPKEQVHEVRYQDRSLFIPLVAMNVAYDWEGGQGGRTSKSWLVGREPQQPEAKMGAFRLDLGPRVYRSVAGREAKLVKV